MSQDPYRYFRVEARELLEQLGKGVLDLERAPPPPELVPRLLRYAHTLKGAARVVKQIGIAELAHAVEDALAPLRENRQMASSESVDAILKQLDEIAAVVATLVLPESKESITAAAPPDEALRTVRTDVAEMDALLEGMAQASVQLGALRRALRGMEHARLLTAQVVDRTAQPRLAPGTRPAGQSHKTRSLATELRSTIIGLERSLVGGLDQLEREVRQVREAAERLRLVPASTVFVPLARIARDSAQSVGRRIEFETRGGEVRLDAHVLAIVQDALVQLVRNAVAHGIEPEADRVRSGKPAAGRVVLEVSRRGNRIGFLCSDDGQGVDLDAVRRIADKKGLTASKQTRDPAELISLLLRGGLTTMGAVTESAGRGVGLDVVRDCASRLGGDVSVRTEPQRGTQVELVVPVSMSSLDALVVEALGITAAIPRDRVLRTMRVKPEDIARVAGGEAVVHEGELIPFIQLARVLRMHRPSSEPRAWPTVVIQGEKSVAAVGVDRLFALANLVLRPLPELAPADPVVAGISLDAEGNPQIVLDADRLVAAASSPKTQLAVSPHAELPPILVIDDSLTTRMLERSILESAGYEVEVAVSAEEGLDKARRRQYGLFLVDVEMPGMDGFSFIEHTRADPLLHAIPAILVTSRNSAEDRQRGQDVGAAGYIVKSEFNQNDLIDKIRRLVS